MHNTDSLPKYIGNLDKTFRHNIKKPLGNYLTKSKRNSTIPVGTLVIMPSTLVLSLKILDRDTPDKGFSIPLLINEAGKIHGITPHYLLWFFRFHFVNKYLVDDGRGTVLPRIPWQTILKLPIPLPIYKNNSTAGEGASNDVFSDKAFRKLIINFYEDYRLNYESRRFTTSIILAGAISEAILYRLMVNSDLDLKTLEEDHSLTLGKLINYAKLLKIPEKLDYFPLTHFQEILKLRNRAIHTGSAIKHKGDDFSEHDLKGFDNIIKYFGL
ncbi:MAG: hypothetical protein JWP58_2009 [Hymenobacter sp.]|nr:hypothetical protein [Hymenobacter sp.]